MDLGSVVCPFEVIEDSTNGLLTLSFHLETLP